MGDYTILSGIFKVREDEVLLLDDHVDFDYTPFLSVGELFDLSFAHLDSARCPKHVIAPQIGNETVRSGF